MIKSGDFSCFGGFWAWDPVENASIIPWLTLIGGVHVIIAYKNTGHAYFTAIALVLIIIGAINWGLVGIFNFNLVDAIFGAMSVISRIIYILVGISGLWAIKLLFDR